MKRLIAIAAVLSACQGCAGKGATVSADSPSAAPVEPVFRWVETAEMAATAD